PYPPMAVLLDRVLLVKVTVPPAIYSPPPNALPPLPPVRWRSVPSMRPRPPRTPLLFTSVLFSRVSAPLDQIPPPAASEPSRELPPLPPTPNAGSGLPTAALFSTVAPLRTRVPRL